MDISNIVVSPPKEWMAIWKDGSKRIVDTPQGGNADYKCAYTGQKDQDGNKLYGGDIIVCYPESGKSLYYLIEWIKIDSRWAASEIGSVDWVDLWQLLSVYPSRRKRIGNIYLPDQLPAQVREMLE